MSKVFREICSDKSFETFYFEKIKINNFDQL